jgi:hypothetical protein
VRDDVMHIAADPQGAAEGCRVDQSKHLGEHPAPRRIPAEFFFLTSL